MIFAESQVPIFSRLGDVTVEELVTRLVVCVLYWFAAYVVIQAYFTGWALLSVSSGLDHPALWRPIFGSVGNAYTVRGFWRYISNPVPVHLFMFPILRIAG